MIYSVSKMLDVSTGHLSKEDHMRLKYREPELPVYELDEYGWLVYVGEINENWEEFSEDFNKIIVEAKKQGCEYVRFDRDVIIYKSFKVFDW